MRVAKDCRCSACTDELTNWDYRYRGNHYCRSCYDRLFKLQICTVCNQRKKIFVDLKVPICKICQVQDKPCTRCGKTGYTPGKITGHGPVCNACSKYFRPYKRCSKCEKSTYTVSNRNLQDGTVRLLCSSCYCKTLPTCSKCRKQRVAYVYDEEDKPVCEICATHSDRKCVQCARGISAGLGNICMECTYKNTLHKRLAFGQKALSPYTSDLFYRFGKWLEKRRGTLFAATQIRRYFLYFYDLDSLSQELQRFPLYSEIIAQFSVATTRKYLLVTRFLNEEGLAVVDKEEQEKYANLDMIKRYMDSFSVDTWPYKIASAYYAYLEGRVARQKTTIRTMRMALGTAVGFLSYCEHFQGQKPTSEILNGYLWKFPGQKSSITGFINFLNSKYALTLVMPEWKKPTLLAPAKGHMQLKQHLIDLLRARGKDHRKFIKVSVEYLHGIGIPGNVILTDKDIKCTKKGDYYLKIAGHQVYLPKEIGHACK